MIYLVTLNKELFDNDTYKIISVEESLKLLEPLKVVGLDSETSSLRVHEGKLLSLQLGCLEFQVVIDCLTIDILLYKEYLESNRLFVGHNLKFDLQWLFLYHIVPQKIYDTYLGEQVLWNGYPIVITIDTYDKIKCDRYEFVSGDDSKKKPHYLLSTSLKAISKLYLGIDRDKSIRGQIIWKGIKDIPVVQYAAEDVQYMELLMNKQLEILKEKGLEKAIDLLNRFEFPVAYMEFCGVRLDTNKWKQKMERDQAELDKALQEMCDWVVKNDPTCPYIYRNLQGDLFSGFDTTPKLNINWNSPKQVIDLFKRYNVSVEVEDKGKSKDSVNAKSLAPQSSKCGLIPIYLKFKEQAKLVGTYGENVLGQIDKNTGRLYTKYNVKGTDTFRVSSGGTDGNTKYINMLNIPADSFTRSCFIAEPNNRWISIDYSGQESFLMASIANDKAMIHELMEGEGDLHTLTAKIVYPEIPKDMPANEVKQKFHKLRSEAKGYEFGFNYGGTAHTIMRNFGLSKTRAEEIERLYMSGFSGLKRYQDWRREDWKKKVYIDLNPIFGFKAFIYDYNYLVNLGSKFDDPEYKAYYHEMKSIDPNCSVVMDRKDYYKRLSESDRQSINYPIQHSGALCSMVAQIIFFNTLRAKDWLFKVLITVCPYDEINCEAPNEIAEEVTTLLYNCMVKAGSYFCTRCKLDADISRDSNGELPTYWIH